MKGASTRKTSRPSLRDVLPRQRLFAALATAKPVAWLTAPPGAGKTTLAASHTEHVATSTWWYQLDSDDIDPATFFHGMRQLASKVSAAKAARLPAFPAQGGVDLAVFARRFFRLLFPLLPAGAIWVIDGYQEAEGASLAVILREAFEEFPPGCSALILSLVGPPAELARLVANGVIRLLDAADLRFTRAESDDLVLSRVVVEPAVLFDIHEKSSGWAAGLVLMIEHLRRASLHGAPSVDDSQSAAFEYFASQIFDGCSAPEQRVLMLSALLPRVTPRLAEVMSRQADGKALFERLHRRNLFVERHAGAEPSYQLHRLFRLFLEAQAQTVLSARERADAMSSAAALLRTDGHAEEAIAVYLSACNWDAAATLVVQLARRLHDQGRWRTLRTWIERLPERYLDEPWLAFWAGASQVWTDPEPSRRLLERAFRRFAAIGERGGQILAAGTLTRACILGMDWKLLDEWIDALKGLLSTDIDGLPGEVLLFGYARLVYAAGVRRPQEPELDAWAGRTRDLLSSAVEPGEAVRAAYSLVAYYFWTGQCARGEEIVRLVAPLLEEDQLDATSRIHWLFAHANHVLRFGEPNEALGLMDEALDLAAVHGVKLQGVIRRWRVVHLLTMGRLDEAETELRKLATAPVIEPDIELKAWLAWQRGQSAVALDEAGKALALATERGRTRYRDFDLALLAAIHATSGDVDEARRQLGRYREATSRCAGRYAEFQALLIEAVIELRGADGTAGHTLRRALQVGAEQRFRSCWAWTPALVVPLLSKALELGIETAYCHELIRSHRLVPGTIAPDQWPWPIRVRTLGRFDVELDGVALRFEGKAQRKPLHLLKLLIAFGDRPVAIERLIELLWPDPDDGGRKAFDITVHRLRRMLGLDSAISVGDRHARLDRRFVWVDAWMLEGLVEPLVPVTGLAPSGSHLEVAAPRVLTLFGGAFLEGEPEAPWLLATRHRIDDSFQRFVERLGRHWEATGQWASAEHLYGVALESDPLAEAFYRQRMVCLQALGRRAEAIEVFRRCQYMLSVRMGVAPAQETERAYRDLSGS